MLCAPLLRKWLVERNFLKIQRQLGTRVEFPVRDMRAEIRACEKGDLTVFAGVETDIAGYPVENFCYSPPGRNPYLPKTLQQIKTLSLQDLGTQRILFWKSIFASRADIIKYVCNKWGGIHIDRKLDDKVNSSIDEGRYLFGFKPEKDKLCMQVNFNGVLELQSRSFPDDFIDIALLGVLNTAQSYCKGTAPYLQKIAALSD